MLLACPTSVAESLPALCRSIDLYCERTSTAFDAEPLNALTAAAMLLPAVATAWLQTTRPNRNAAGLIWAMIAAITAGAFGATLFHTVAIVWTVWVDTLPFLVFMLLVLWLTLTRFFVLPAAAAAVALLLFLALTFGASALAPPGVLPGSAYYLTPLVVLAAAAAMLVARRSPAAPSYVAGTIVFLAAIVAREADGRVCGALPAGTHFVWHLLAALLAFILIRAAILYAPARGQLRETPTRAPTA